MTFYVEKETDYDFGFDEQALISQVATRALESEHCPYDEVTVNVLNTDNEGIREYNREYRDIDKETDVLSFPNLDFEEPGVFDLPESRKADYFDPDTGELVLGDIILSTDRIRSQAEEYGHSQRREMAFLVAHSILHLCGYDHMEEEARIVMEEKQEAILQSLGITREEG
jgi:probable rRNA maturation factor